jgi:hypothetical protein
MQAPEKTTMKTAQTWEQEGTTTGEPEQSLVRWPCASCQVLRGSRRPYTAKGSAR